VQEGRRTHPRYLVAGVVISLCEFDLPDGNDDALLEKLHSCQDIVQGWHDPNDFSLWVPLCAA
jgi:hypothetical protein